MWGVANEAKVDQTTEMYFLFSDPFINNAELLRKQLSAFHRILSWHQEMMIRDQEKHKMYFPSLCLKKVYFDGLGCLWIAALD